MAKTNNSKRNSAFRPIVLGALLGCFTAALYQSAVGIREAHAGFGFKASSQAKFGSTCRPCDSGTETCDC